MNLRLNSVSLALVALGNYVVPKSNRIVLHSFPDVEDQLVAVLRQFAVAGTARASVILLVSGDPALARSRLQLLVGGYVDSIRIRRKGSLAGVWAYWRARYVLFTHGLYGFWPIPSRQIVVNLWHGMPTKAIWRVIPNSPVPYCTYLLSTSAKFSQVMADASGLSETIIRPLGLPRNDLLFSTTQAAIEFGRRTKAGMKHLVVFLPTYRQSKIGYITNDGQEMDNTLLMDEGGIRLLCERLKESGARMLVKPHPMSIHYGQDIKIDEHLWIVSDRWLHEQGVVLYEALGQADVLITDTSSVYVDFLALGRPSLCYFPDIELYRKTRKFLFEPIEDWIPGEPLKTPLQLCSALTKVLEGEDPYRQRRIDLARVLNPHSGFGAAERLQRLLGLTGGGENKKMETEQPSAVVALVWSQYGPYHFARWKALQGSHRLKVLAVEIASRTLTYAWNREDGENRDLISLLPGKAVEHTRAVEIYSRALSLFRAQKVQVVFVPSYWPASSLAVILAARVAGARVVMMNESHALTAKARGLVVVVKKFLIRQFDAALLGGQPHRDYFVTMGLPDRKIDLGYDAVDNRFFAARAAVAVKNAGELRAKHGLPERYFLSIGRMVAKKNLGTIVEAYIKLRQELGAECPRLVFVGSGKEEWALTQKCLAAGLSLYQKRGANAGRLVSDADVYFFGFRQAGELAEFYALASAFVLASWEEEWGLVVNEAMACGCPVIVSRVAGCAPDLVRQGENGYCFDPHDPADLAECLKKIAESPVLERKMGEASTSIIAEWGCERFAAGVNRTVEIALNNA